MKTKIKAVLFDIDDTLYDREKAQYLVLDKIVETLPQVFGALNKHQVLEAFLESDRISTAEWEAGRHMEDIRDYRSILFLKALNLSIKHVRAITETYVKEYPFINAPVDGAYELVQKTSRVFKTGVISNSMPDVQYQKIKTLGLERYFKCIILATEIGLKKPDPEIFIHTAKQLKLKPAECLYIGDNYQNDVMGARGAGMATCWLCRRNALVENPYHADYIVRSLKEAGVIINQL